MLSSEHIDAEEQHLRREREEAYRRTKEEGRVRLQQRFLSGADRGWTELEKPGDFYCRRNGRTFRTVRGKDKRSKLHRVNSIEAAGVLGYLGRGDANKALAQIAYQPEPSKQVACVRARGVCLISGCLGAHGRLPAI